MRALILILILFTSLPALDDRRILMHSISHHAIQIGDGPNKVYAFIDPLCYKSQDFIQMITTRKDLQEDSTYYIFFYQLQQYQSLDYIVYIYQAKDSLEALKDIMIYEDYDIVDTSITPKTQTIINEIKKVAKQMEIKTRPYLLIFNEGSKYCTVSDGTAPCLEENDFD